jgi:hypothetical protein
MSNENESKGTFIRRQRMMMQTLQGESKGKLGKHLSRMEKATF